MLVAVGALTPLLILMALGAVLFWRGFLDSKVRRGMDRLIYWAALPSLFVATLSETDFQGLQAGGLIGVLILGAVLGTGLAAAAAAGMKLKPERFGVFVQAGSRGNMAFVGLPLIIFAAEAMGGDASQQAVAIALVGLAAMVPVSNLLAVMALVFAGEGVRLGVLPRLLVQVVRNPLVISALIGGGLGWMGWGLPSVVLTPLELLGQTALALALLSLGGALVEFELKGQVGLSLGAGLFKVGVMPAITFGLALGFGLGELETLVAMIFAACPTAAASYVLATQLGGDEAFAAAAVVVSTFLSVVGLAVVLVLF